MTFDYMGLRRIVKRIQRVAEMGAAACGFSVRTVLYEAADGVGRVDLTRQTVLRES